MDAISEGGWKMGKKKENASGRGVKKSGGCEAEDGIHGDGCHNDDAEEDYEVVDEGVVVVVVDPGVMRMRGKGRNPERCDGKIVGKKREKKDHPQNDDVDCRIEERVRQGVKCVQGSEDCKERGCCRGKKVGGIVGSHWRKRKKKSMKEGKSWVKGD